MEDAGDAVAGVEDTVALDVPFFEFFFLFLSAFVFDLLIDSVLLRFVDACWTVFDLPLDTMEGDLEDAANADDASIVSSGGGESFCEAPSPLVELVQSALRQ